MIDLRKLRLLLKIWGLLQGLVLAAAYLFFFLFLYLQYMCSSIKYPYSPTASHKGLEIPGRGGGVSRPKSLKKIMYEAKLEFPEGIGGLGKSPSCEGEGGRGGGGMGVLDGYYFSRITLHIITWLCTMLHIDMYRARNCDSLVANATKNWVLATRFSQLVASWRLTFSPITQDKQ